MANEMMISEHQVAKEVIQNDDPKACTPSPQSDEKHYSSVVHLDKDAELVHAQEQLVMLQAEQAGISLTNMAMYESMANVVGPTHIAATHLQSQAAPYYQVLPPPTYYQQAHYSAPVPAPQSLGEPTHASVAQPYAPTTVMYVPMPYYQEAQPAIRHHTTIANVAALPPSMAYHQVPVEYAPAPMALPQHPGPQQPASTLPASGFKTANRQRVVIWNYCQFCQNNKEPEEFYRSHTLRDTSGRVLCPVLRAYNCPLCNNGGGDRAHTKSYCPQLRNRQQLNGGMCHSGRRHNVHGNGMHNGHQQAKLKNAHGQQYQANLTVVDQEPIAV